MTRISVPGELFAALWLDPLEAKSSFFHSLKVGFPRFVFPFPPVGLWARFLQHGFGVAGLFLCFAFFYFLEKRRDRITGVRGARSRRDVCWLGGTALCLAVLTWLAPASLSQWLTSVRHSFPLENLLTQVVAYVPLYHFLYLLGRRSSREQLEKSDRWLLGGVTFFLLLNVVGFGASRVSYLWTVAPFSLCLYWKTLSILSPDYGDKLVRLGALGVVAVYLFVLPVSGMGPLRTLDRPYLRGLWMKDLLASQFEAEDQFYRPLVEGRRTLWLCAGPNSLTDSLPVPSIANLYADQYARRSERHLRQIWSLNPPDLIVDCGFLADPRAEFLKPEILKPWIDQQYRRVAVRGLVGVYRHSDSKQ